MLFCPGMGTFGNRRSFLFVEPNENPSFSERKMLFFSTEMENIKKIGKRLLYNQACGFSKISLR